MESQITWVENKKAAPPTLEKQRWSVEAIEALFALPFNDLIFKAQQVHREHFDANTVQLSTLLSIKTGGCPEDCGYCPQSAKYNTGVEAEKLMPIDEVLKAAQAAKDKGATRFCMGAAWRSPKDHQVEAVGEMVTAVKAMGLETCVTLGMLKEHQAKQLQEAGLDYWIRSTVFVMRVLKCVVAVLWAWVKPLLNVPGLLPNWPIWQNPLKAYRSTIW